MVRSSPSKMRCLWAAVLPLMAAGADVGVAPDSPPQTDAIRERLASLSAEAPVRSSDGRTTVSGAALKAPDKLVLLRFIEDVRTRMARLVSLPFDGPDYAIDLQAVAGEPDAPCQLSVNVAFGRTPPVRIVVRNPQALQAPDLAEQLCGALLRADAGAHGFRDPGEGVPADPRCAPYPPWLGAGVARLLDGARRQDDAEAVLARWTAAQLPGAPTLVTAFSPYASADTALAAQLAAWLLDAPDRAARLDRLRTTLAEGQPWSPGLVAEAIGCGPEPGVLDGAWDCWLLARRWAVLSPGTTSAGLIHRTRDQLRVWPGAPGTPLDATPQRKPLDPSELIALREAPWMSGTAAYKLVVMQRLASGRDQAYRDMAEAYCTFFVGLQQRDSASRLTRSLNEAEERLVALESAFPLALPPAH